MSNFKVLSYSSECNVQLNSTEAHTSSNHEKIALCQVNPSDNNNYKSWGEIVKGNRE